MPGEYETLIYDRDGTRGRITLNRPELLNAVAMTGARELEALAREIELDPALRLVTIAGSGRALIRAGYGCRFTCEVSLIPVLEIRDTRSPVARSVKGRIFVFLR